jgi:hypothetical protein
VHTWIFAPLYWSTPGTVVNVVTVDVSTQSEWRSTFVGSNFAVGPGEFTHQRTFPDRWKPCGASAYAGHYWHTDKSNWSYPCSRNVEADCQLAWFTHHIRPAAPPPPPEGASSSLFSFASFAYKMSAHWIPRRVYFELSEMEGRRLVVRKCRYWKTLFFCVLAYKPVRR